jgi:cyclopropane-fatty-acyl-phospholipid synthase
MNENIAHNISNQRKALQRLLDLAGITINGNQPYDPTFHNEEAFSRILKHKALGTGESYMDGSWDCPKLDELFYKVLTSNVQEQAGKSLSMILQLIAASCFNLQTTKRAKIVGEKHYDVGNELYSLMLDPTMSYSCGYWQEATTLEQAQIDKLDLICRKLELKQGETLLDIGCGWGGLAKYAAENYGVTVTGVTISKEQHAHAEKITADLPVTILLQDYRHVTGTFDKVVSVGMFEHVGYKNYREFMQVANAKLKDNGLFLLHTIADFFNTKTCDVWIAKYIFPNGNVPGNLHIEQAANGIFHTEDLHNFGLDYDKTLMAWHANFNNNWHQIKDQYDTRFFRMWNYYLLQCAGSFRAKVNHLFQIVYSKPTRLIRYNGVR